MKKEKGNGIKSAEAIVTDIVTSRAQAAAPKTFVGGGVGGVLGFLFGGPVGAAIGAGIGAFLGGTLDQGRKE